VGISAQPPLSGGFESGACDAVLAGGEESGGLLFGDEAAADVGAAAGGVFVGSGVNGAGGELPGAGDDAGEPSAAAVGVDAGSASAPDCEDGGESFPCLDAGVSP